MYNYNVPNLFIYTPIYSLFITIYMLLLLTYGIFFSKSKVLPSTPHYSICCQKHSLVNYNYRSAIPIVVVVVVVVVALRRQQQQVVVVVGGGYVQLRIQHRKCCNCMYISAKCTEVTPSIIIAQQALTISCISKQRYFQQLALEVVRQIERRRHQFGVGLRQIRQAQAQLCSRAVGPASSV